MPLVRRTVSRELRRNDFLKRKGLLLVQTTLNRAIFAQAWPHCSISTTVCTIELKYECVYAFYFMPINLFFILLWKKILDYSENWEEWKEKETSDREQRKIEKKCIFGVPMALSLLNLSTLQHLDYEMIHFV